MNIINYIMNKNIRDDWDLQSEFIIALSFFLFSLTVFVVYHGVLFSASDNMFNTSLTYISVALFPIFCALRLYAIYKFKRLKYFATITTTIDILLLSSLIYMFSQQYGTAAATLKSPSFAFYFVFIGLHAIRFNPKITFLSGLLSVCAWYIIVFNLSRNSENIAHSYHDYVTSNAILFGAEFEKLFALIVFTIVLALSSKRAHDVHEKEVISHDQLDQEKRISQMKTEFLDTMSHEIRTPMNGVLGMVQTLRLTQLTEKQTTMLNIMEKSGDCLVNLLNDILEFSRLSDGGADLNTNSFNLKNLLFEIGNEARPDAAQKGLDLFIGLDPKTPQNLIGDNVRIQHIIQNLLSNAVKFTHKGYVSLNIHGTKKHNQATIHFEVHDTGIGIESERINDIFNIFQQVDGSKTRQYGGSGLGLALAQRIATNMGSHISVSSVIGKGSTFQFTLSLPIEAQKLPPKDLHVPVMATAQQRPYLRPVPISKKLASNG